MPAYSTLDDQNNFVFVPVLSFEEEKDNRAEPGTAVQLNEAQTLWQKELDASSGQSFRYNMLSQGVGQGRQGLADQEATVVPELPTSFVVSLAEVERVPRNVQRSLLHRLLVSPLPIRKRRSVQSVNMEI